MEPKLLKTTQAEYVLAEYGGTNESGYRPFGDRVLVLPDTAARKTAGGIEIPDDVQERQSYAAETGVIIEAGDGAFVWNSDRTRRWEGAKPKSGDRVFFDRYSGGIVHGRDGRTYRIIDDKAIACVSIETDAAAARTNVKRIRRNSAAEAKSA